jgi:hypothetical protein
MKKKRIFLGYAGTRGIGECILKRHTFGKLGNQMSEKSLHEYSGETAAAKLEEGHRLVT